LAATTGPVVAQHIAMGNVALEDKFAPSHSSLALQHILLFLSLSLSEQFIHLVSPGRTLTRLVHSEMWALSSPYWVFPIVSAGTWLGMLLAMFIRWEVIGQPHYPSMDPKQHIAYISDVGAFGLKPLFISGSVVTTVFLDLAFISERWLRHTGRLAQNTSKAQKILSAFSIIFAIAGSAGLILLSIFDTYHHPRLHDGFLLLFIGGYIISAIFTCAEYQRLGIHYRNHRIIRISFWVKLAIVFVSTNFTKRYNVAAVFEWVVALVFTFYVLSFLLDLLPSVRTKHHVPQGFREGPAIEKGETRHQHQGAEYEQNLTNDSAGPNDDSNAGYRGTATNGYASTNTTLNGEAPVEERKKGFGRLHF
jgi:hypothetical protein